MGNRNENLIVNVISVEKLTCGKYIVFDCWDVECSEWRKVCAFRDTTSLGIIMFSFCTKYQICEMGINKMLKGVRRDGTEEFVDETLFIGTEYERLNQAGELDTYSVFEERMRDCVEFQQWMMYDYASAFLTFANNILKFKKGFESGNTQLTQEDLDDFYNKCVFDEDEADGLLERFDLRASLDLDADRMKTIVERCGGTGCVEITKTNYKSFSSLDIVAFYLIKPYIATGIIIMMDTKQVCYLINYGGSDIALDAVYEICPPLYDCRFTARHCIEMPQDWFPFSWRNNERMKKEDVSAEDYAFVKEGTPPVCLYTFSELIKNVD